MKYKKEKHVAHERHAAHTAPKSQFWEPMTIALVLVIVVLLAYIGYNSMSGQQQPPSGNSTVINNTTPPKQANVTLELFVMSKCPYGVQAETAVKNVIDKFGGDVNLSLHFIASQGADGTFSSLHGNTEVQEDLRQVCIMKYYPTSLIGYLACVANGYSNIEQVWESCASQNNIDVNKITTCSTSNEASSLLASNIQRTNQLNIQSSPTIYLNGKPYNGAASENSITKAICAVTPGSDTCKNLPPEVVVGLTIVSDKNCIVCDPSQIVSTLQSRFEMNNLSIKNVDYSSDEGKALVQQFNLTGVPAYIFNSSIVSHSGYSSLSQYLRKVGSSYLLLVQPVKLVNVVERNNTVQLFVMSWCPYGTAAEIAMNELLNAIPDLKFLGLYFIATESGNGTFTSLHGQGEVEENLRQVCVIRYYNTSTLFNYLVCVDANVANSSNMWRQCATNSKMDVAKIGNCSTGDEGKALLQDNIKLANSMSIYSSPTLIMNNNTMFNAVSAEQMRQVVCGYNPALAGCNKTLSGQGTSTTSGGCG
ncbi:thioredoxin domain-containing protein [Candidatus Micrarchaeota archaeon]|nr:thioredoxin domain-containing protein [Candidatus Micrarchaeota archaeon]